MNEKIDIPWKSEEEFYNLHAFDLFSHFEFYHVAVLGNSAQEFMEHIIERARIAPGDRILDLGCGSGYLVNELSKLGEACGISTSAECIKFCKEQYPSSRYELGNMETYKANDLTHALALESLAYADLEKTMNNVFSSLAPGGYFYCKDWCKYERESMAQTINREVFEYYWKYYPKTVLNMIQTATRCGFELVEFRDLTGKTNYDFFMETVPLHRREFALPFPDVWIGLAAEFLFKKPD